VLAGLGLLLVAACSDDTSVKSDLGRDARVREAAVEAALPDTGAPDLRKDSKPGVTKMGEGCVNKDDCGADAPLCLMPTGGSLGICSKACTPDDPGTPLLNEDDCGEGNLCSTFTIGSKDYFYCLKTCKPSTTKTNCPASSKRTCHPFATRYTGDLAVPACWYMACQSDKDCPVFGAKTCVLDSECTGLGADAYCDSAGRCARPGKCTAGGLCGTHALGKATAKVGDPCTADFDCPGSGRCLTETSEAGAVGLSWKNGYCVVSYCSFAAELPDSKCPTGSTCNNLYYGGLCFKSCALDVASDCRGNAADKGGDYECYAWDNLVTGSGQQKISEGPICMSAATQTCDSLGTKLDCTALADSKKPTNMSCRDRFTGVKKANKADPTGVCLDDTASGPFDPVVVPDAKVSDQGAKDAGVKEAAVKADSAKPDAAKADAAKVDAAKE